MRQKLQNFMAGRYGTDQLCLALIVSALIINIFAKIFSLGFLALVSLLMFIFAVYRTLSKNIVKRRAENAAFLDTFLPIKHWARRLKERSSDSKTHKFFKCPNCKNTLRVPRGKGKIQITCPKCGERFERKS